MGEAQRWLFEPSFNRAVKVQAGDERITSDSGLLLLREADERKANWSAVSFFLRKSCPARHSNLLASL